MYRSRASQPIPQRARCLTRFALLGPRRSRYRTGGWRLATAAVTAACRTLSSAQLRHDDAPKRPGPACLECRLERAVGFATILCRCAQTIEIKPVFFFFRNPARIDSDTVNRQPAAVRRLSAGMSGTNVVRRRRTWNAHSTRPSINYNTLRSQLRKHGIHICVLRAGLYVVQSALPSTSASRRCAGIVYSMAVLSSV